MKLLRPNSYDDCGELKYLTQKHKTGHFTCYQNRTFSLANNIG